ncbi:hypothetical protein [Chitinophaga sp. YIM B06452]|uniref:hypothetical protein n=1 Tax=Chitinophaga sp. YIM B06452 TaxID=3082158 RepID=UPI0031FF320C
MKCIVLIHLFIIPYLGSFGQDCSRLFEVDKFTKDKTSNLFLKGIEDIKPFVRLELNIGNGYPNYIRIQLHAGDGKKNQFGLEEYDNLTRKYISNERNSISLYLLFEDDKSFQLFRGEYMMYSNSVSLNKSEINADFLAHLKNKRVTDIRFEFNNIRGDFSIPDSQQNYFIQITQCLKW